MPGVDDLVSGGQLFVAIPIALLAGIISFLSPCILPLVPGYLGYVGGLSGADGKEDRSRLLLGVGLFILGFMAVFVATTTVAGALGTWLVVYDDVIVRVAGVLVIALGLVFIGQFAFVQRTVKPRWIPATGIAGAPLLGIVFGLGWTPCLGPTLITITALSLNSASATQGAILGVFYSLGIGIPFLLIAIGFGWVSTSVDWVKKHIRVVNVIGGSMLVLIGVLMVSGLWSVWMSQLGAVINVFVTPL
ncbi:MAG: cytochrome c biogenesis CcdA family protein [Microbacteriaceae bacterium]